MDRETLGAIELSMTVIIFAAIVYVIVGLIMIDAGVPGTSFPTMPFSNSTFAVATTAQCNATYIGPIPIPFTDWTCAVSTFIAWLAEMVINVASFVVGIVIWLFTMAYTVFLFGFIWYGAPVNILTPCSVTATCVIDPFPEPWNILFGLPLTGMGVFMFISVARHIVSLLPFWGK